MVPSARCLLILNLLVAVLTKAHQCDVGIRERTDWGNKAVNALTEQGFSAARGQLKFAPFGSISNPNGTYGTLFFGNYSAQFPEPSNEFCQCLTGDVSVSPSCFLLESPLASSDKESVCKSNLVLSPKDVVVVISCTPPNSQYFAMQTNIYSKFSGNSAGSKGRSTNEKESRRRWNPLFSKLDQFKETNSSTGLFFPEISPYNALNNKVLNTTSRQSLESYDDTSPFNSAFVTISTADKNSASTVVEALQQAGVPSWAINIDPLFSADVNFWDGSNDWRLSLPDSFELVYRINGAIDQEGANQYVLESEFSPLHQAFLFRAPSSNDDVQVDAMEPLSEVWVPRIVSAEEEGQADSYNEALDELAQVINDTAKASGYTLSYYGDAFTAMDYGYSQGLEDDTVDEDDVDQCCLSYPHNSEFWSSTIHFSTKDCLYEIYGWKADTIGGWNDYQPALLSTTRYVNTAITGPAPANLSQFYSFSCDGTNASGYDALRINYYCSESTCGQCGWTGTAEVAGIPQGCLIDDDDDDDDDSVYEKYTCIEGVPYVVLYSDSTCTNAVYNYDLSQCKVSDTDHPTDEMWTGGVFKENSLVIMIGAMSNNLGSSDFHDIYMPIPGTYNSPDMQLDFTEAELQASALAFMPPNGPAADPDSDVYANMFVAQWGRACLSGQDGTMDNVACYEVPDDIMFTNSTFFMLVRHYLDPKTGTGPHKDALPRHRVMVFDKP